MEIKLFEVRDKGTFLPVIAIKLGSSNEAERYLLGRAGYGLTTSQHNEYVLMGSLHGGELTYSPFSHGSARTRQVAHQYIIENFDELEAGSVVDVEFILGETKEPKLSEAISSLY